jgi:hypothetical protein
VGGADALETEGLVLQGVRVSYVRASCEAELPIISIGSVQTKVGEAVTTVRPRSHKALQAEGFWGDAWKDVKRVSGNYIGELRNNSGGRWGRIPGIRGGVSKR